MVGHIVTFRLPNDRRIGSLSTDEPREPLSADSPIDGRLVLTSRLVVIFARVKVAGTSDCKRVRGFIAASPRT